MFVGFLMIGMVTGLMAAFAALVVGQGIGVALLAYVITGLIVTLLGGLISQLPATRYRHGLTTSTRVLPHGSWHTGLGS